MNLNIWGSGCAVPSTADVEAFLPFTEGWEYWQVDLGGRDVVEQLGRYYSSEEDTAIGVRAMSVVAEIDRMHKYRPESVAIYLHHEDPQSQDPVAWIYSGRQV